MAQISPACRPLASNVSVDINRGSRWQRSRLAAVMLVMANSKAEVRAHRHGVDALELVRVRAHQPRHLVQLASRHVDKANVLFGHGKRSKYACPSWQTQKLQTKRS